MAAKTVAGSIKEAMVALGGDKFIEEVKQWIKARYGDKWKNIATDMADLTYPGNNTST